MRKFIPVEEVFKEWRKNPEFVAAFDAMEEEFALSTAFMLGRAAADMTQADVARAMGTSTSAIVRMESGRRYPSMRTLRRFAEATGTQLKISFEKPKAASRSR